MPLDPFFYYSSNVVISTNCPLPEGAVAGRNIRLLASSTSEAETTCSPGCSLKESCMRSLYIAKAAAATSCAWRHNPKTQGYKHMCSVYIISLPQVRNSYFPFPLSRLFNDDSKNNAVTLEREKKKRSSLSLRAKMNITSRGRLRFCGNDTRVSQVSNHCVRAFRT